MEFWESKRLYYRALGTDDFGGKYLSWMNNPLVTRYLESRFFPQTPTSLASFVESAQANGDLLLAICLKDTKAHIGNIKISGVHPVHQVGEMGIVIGVPDVWGKGYAPEAIASICQYAFSERNLRKIIAGYYANNMGSARAFAKAGFVQEAVFKQQFYSGGEWVDHIWASKFRNDQPTQKQQTPTSKGNSSEEKC